MLWMLSIRNLVAWPAQIFISGFEFIVERLPFSKTFAKRARERESVCVCTISHWKCMYSLSLSLLSPKWIFFFFFQIDRKQKPNDCWTIACPVQCTPVVGPVGHGSHSKHFRPTTTTGRDDDDDDGDLASKTSLAARKKNLVVSKETQQCELLRICYAINSTKEQRPSIHVL